MFIRSAIRSPRGVQVSDGDFLDWRAPTDSTPRAIWIEEALARGNALSPPLDFAGRYQVCIVGGGFTGLWTAIRLREQDPALSIAILEADFCGAGASGRNSGAIGSWWSKLPALIRLVGQDDAVTILKASVAAVQDVEDFVVSHVIVAHALLRRKGRRLQAHARCIAQAGRSAIAGYPLSRRPSIRIARYIFQVPELERWQVPNT